MVGIASTYVRHTSWLDCALNRSWMDTRSPECGQLKQHRQQRTPLNFWFFKNNIKTL